MRHHPLLWIPFRGILMRFRTACAALTLLISLVGRGSESHAQSYPDQSMDRPVLYGDGEDDPNLAVGTAARGSGGLSRTDPRIPRSTRGDPAGLAALPPEVRPETGSAKELPNQFRRALVEYYTKEAAGTIIVDTANTYLYLVLGNGRALRYGIGVGREGFTWSGSEKVSRMAEWPDWNPPEQMIERQPYLPRFMAGGEGNPLGARALYLGDTLFRIHGTNQPSTIGTFVSSGCIRLTNEDITDLYKRVRVGTRVVVLSAKPDGTAAARVPSARQALSPVTSGANSDPDPPSQKRKGEATNARSQQVHVSVSGGRGTAVTQETATSENRSRSETGGVEKRERGPRTLENEVGSIQANPSPMQLKQEAGAFEE
jgi:lipoprotein-anchoring transpeptidase ErfK/SrfK